MNQANDLVPDLLHRPVPFSNAFCRKSRNILFSIKLNAKDILTEMKWIAKRIVYRNQHTHTHIHTPNGCLCVTAFNSDRARLA